MNGKIAAGLMFCLAAVACDRPGKSDKGMGAGADTAGLRDTAMPTPTPAPAPTDSVKDSTKQQSSANPTPKNQTQSGMKDKAGQSTLGPAVKRTRPDANQPVTAKGDTLSRSADDRATDSLNKAVLDRLTPKDSTSITGRDTMPQPTPVPVPIPPVPTDTTKPAPPDSAQPVPTDSLKPVPTDSTRTPPPLPLDTIRPMRDSTKRDTTKQH